MVMLHIHYHDHQESLDDSYDRQRLKYVGLFGLFLTIGAAAGTLILYSQKTPNFGHFLSNLVN